MRSAMTSSSIGGPMILARLALRWARHAGPFLLAAPAAAGPGRALGRGHDLLQRALDVRRAIQARRLPGRRRGHGRRGGNPRPARRRGRQPRPPGGPPGGGPDPHAEWPAADAVGSAPAAGRAWPARRPAARAGRAAGNAGPPPVRSRDGLPSVRRGLPLAPRGAGISRLLPGAVPGRRDSGPAPARGGPERLAVGLVVRGLHRGRAARRAERGPFPSRLRPRLQDRLLRMLARPLSLFLL